MEKASITGPMEECMMDIMKMIKNMDLVLIDGFLFNFRVMEGLTKDFGIMENNMEEEFLFLKIAFEKRESGRMESELNGLMT